MVQKCCVLGCPSTSDVPSHKFPSSLEMLELWKNKIKFFRKSAPTVDDFGKFRVCQAHFGENDYKPGGYKLRLLKDNVVPTLNLPVNIENEGTPNVTLPEHDELGSVQVHGSAMEENNDVFGEPGPSSMQAMQKRDCSTPRSLRSSPKRRRLQILEKPVSTETDLTPVAARLYRVATRMRRQQLTVSRKLFGYKRRLRAAEKYVRGTTFERCMSSMSYDQRVFINMQIRNTRRGRKGRRFTMEEKILALSVYKQSGKCYRFLEKIFALPTGRSLRKILHAIHLRTGCNEFIKEQLKSHAETMKEIDKVCYLMWDEMALQPHIDYNQTTHNITGFEDYETRRYGRYADHALVFMLRGIQKGWKLPIAHFFTDSQANSEILITCIKSITKVIIDCGLIPVAYVCDQAKPNVAAINKLKSESYIKMSGKLKYENSIHLYDHEIIPLYDPPHLIKGIRNNLLRRDLEIDFKDKPSDARRFASWKIVELAFNMDTHSNSMSRIMPKITVEHIKEKYIRKMKVKLAVQVLSRTMAAFIDHHTQFDSSMNTPLGTLRMPKEGHDTAEALLFFNRLFDSVNGHSYKEEAPLRAVVTNDSRHHNFWTNALKKLENMRFVNMQTKQPVYHSPVIKHWIATVQGFQSLWLILKQFGFKFFKPRYINQDPLENFFGSMRSLNFRYTNPTCTHFESSLKTLLLNNLTSRQLLGSNCENICNGNLLFTIQNLTPVNSNIASDTEQIENLVISDFANTEYITFLDPKLSDQIIFSIFRNKEIESCFCCNTVFSDRNKCQFIDETYKVLLTSLPNICFKQDLKLILQTIMLTNINFDFVTCKEHRDTVIKLYTDYSIFYTVNSWCRTVNEILSGKQRKVRNNHPIYKKAIHKSQRHMPKKKLIFQN